MPYMVENIVRKGEIACYKQYFSFSHNVFHIYISLVRQNETLCGNGITDQVKNQSVENAGVAFVKGVNERNKFLEKINKQ